MSSTDEETKTEAGADGTMLYAKPKNRIYLYNKLIRTHETMGAWLIFWPSAWSVMLAAKDTSVSLPQLIHCLFRMMVLSFITISISSIYNDVLDKDFDKEVKRCKVRPVESGAVSTGEALVLLVPFLIGFALLLMQVNANGKAVMLVSLGILFIYPLAKRFTKYPAVVLGLGTNNGIFLGWILVRGDVEWSVCVPLLFGAFFWTIVYDTIYGLQDKEDDARVGVKSMALSFGSRIRTLMGASAALATACFAATGVAAGLAWPYYVAVTAVLAHLFIQVFTVNMERPEDCGAKYQSNQTLALILFLGIVAENWCRGTTWEGGKIWTGEL